ncbi:antibiotic biosynthesis monooxygenase [Archangium violaceum]|uniref:VOC family protein n=1 Tax=Archangium violaceum TaxID=83451 RepID=UPI00195046E3|nr:VOC family protein [Archangium violaceum]QRN94369.1 antibiotic biosynthesis monooxygenase [Archangium violaceum]
MTKLIGPDFIALQVRDLEASRRFYTEHLGLTPVPHGPPDAVVFDTHPIPFAIRRPLVDLALVDRLGWGLSLWLASDDADGLHERLVGARVPILAPPANGPFGRFFSFRDPDGYAITVHTARQESQRTTLDPSAGHLTLINTFTVAPERADELLALLSRATEETMRHLPGFISANLHVSGDRRHIANYAQWRSRVDYEAMLKSPEARVHMREAAEIAQSFEPVFYELRQSHAPGRAP